MSAESVFIYQAPFKTQASHPFWQALKLSITHAPETTLVVVPSASAKQWLMHHLDLKTAPFCQTLDHWILSNCPFKPLSSAWQSVYLKQTLLKSKLPLATTILEHPALIQHLDQLAQHLAQYGPIPASLPLPKHTQERLTQALAIIQNMPKFSHLYDAYDHFCSQPTALPNTLFVFGFWDIPPHQKRALQTLLTLVPSSSILMHALPDFQFMSAAYPLLQWIQELNLPIRTLSPPGLPQLPPETIGTQYSTLEHEVAGILDQVTTWLNQNHPASSIQIVVPNINQYAPILFRLAAHRGISIARLQLPLTSSKWVGDCLASLKSGKSTNLYLGPLVENLPKTHWSELCCELIERLKTLVIPQTNQGWTPQIHALESQALAQLSGFFQEALTTLPQALSLAQFLTIFQDWILKQTLTLTQPDGIVVSGKFEAFYSKASFRILAGLTQHFWPYHVPENVFLPDVIKQSLNQPTQDTYTQWDAFLFFSLAQQTENKLCLSTHSQDTESALLISPFVRDLETHWGVSLTFDPPPDQPATPLLRSIWASPRLDYPEKSVTFIYPFTQNLWASDFINRPLSATQLESYQTCPHAYFFKYGLYETEPPPNLNQVPANEWGTYLHHIVHTFLTEAITHQTWNNLHTHPEKSKNTLRSITQSVPLPHPGWAWQIKASTLWSTETLSGTLDEWLILEHQDATQQRPIETEQAHQFQVATPWNHPLTLQGKLDAVFETSTHERILIDFKTSQSLPTISDIQKFRSLQLPLYWMMAEHTHPNKPIAAAGYIQLHNPFHVQKTLPLVSEETAASPLTHQPKRPVLMSAAFKNQFIEHLLKLASLIKSGWFSHELHPELSHISASIRGQACRNCPYKRMCRYDARFSTF